MVHVDAAAAVTGAAINVVTVNAGYAYAKILSGLERRTTSAVIPTKVRSDPQSGADAAFSLPCEHVRAKMATPQAGEPGRSVRHDRFLTSPAGDCRRCEFTALCLSKGRTNKAIVLGDKSPAVWGARRRRERCKRPRGVSANAIGGARPAFTARPRLGMASHEPPDAASRTPASRRY